MLRILKNNVLAIIHYIRRLSVSAGFAIILVAFLRSAVADVPGGNQTRQFQLGIKLLERADTWCKGAAILAKLGDPEAAVWLVRAWRTPVEASHLCLADAMESLGGASLGDRFAVAPDVQHRLAGLVLIGLFGDDAHLPRLESMVASDPNADLRREAIRVLRQQKRTPAWRQAVFRLLDAADVETRAAAVGILTGDSRDEIIAALGARMAREPNFWIKVRIAMALLQAKIDKLHL